jgi:hypothetical protein
MFKFQKFNLLLLLFLPGVIYAQGEIRDTFYLFYLGGQSNMDGYGLNKDLPESLKKDFEDCWIFHGNSLADGQLDGGKGVWRRLKPGHGAGFSYNGRSNKYSERFGPELSFSKRIQELMPGKKIALIKYSRGGTSIDSMATGQFGCWEPDFRKLNGINQYDHFLNTVKNAFVADDVNQDGVKDYLLPVGILWMQGESDASFTEEIALRYHENLKKLMDLIRASMRMDDLPVVIGKISDSWNSDERKVWKYGELVQYAQEKFAKNDSKAEIVRETRYYKYSDPWHYDSAGYIDLGEKMADAMHKLIQMN